MLKELVRLIFAVGLFIAFVFAQDGAWTSLVENGDVSYRPPMLRAASAVYSKALNQVVLFGGIRDDSIVLSDRWRYDVGSKSWVSVVNNVGPSARSAHTAVVYNGKMIVWGGVGVSSPIDHNEIWEYGLEGVPGILDIWTQVTGITGTPPDGRSYHTAVVINDKMIIYGGAGFASFIFDDIASYDLVQKSWSTVTTSGTSPGELKRHSAVVSGSKMILFGGINDNGQVNTVHVLDFGQNPPMWSTPSNSGPTRDSHSAVVIGQSMLVFGGTLGVADTNTLYSYNIQTPGWTLLAPSGTASNTELGGVVGTGLNHLLVIRGKDVATTFNVGSEWSPSAAFTPVTTDVSSTAQATTASTTAESSTAAPSITGQTSVTTASSSSSNTSTETTTQEQASFNEGISVVPSLLLWLVVATSQILINFF